MKTHILTGTREEIVARLSQIEGAIQKVVVIVEPLPPSEPAPLSPEEEEAMWAEMEPYMSDAENVDYSREAMYERYPGEYGREE
jgi:hypothetical protein